MGGPAQSLECSRIPIENGNRQVVIQFALLFGLGFLSATLLVMLIVPAIHRRVVRYTENRLKATLPISPQEVRAQRDMARAVYAAENARTKQELLQERDRNIALQLRNDTLAGEAKRLQGENSDLETRVGDLDVEAADARSRMRQEDTYIQQLKTAMAAIEERIVAKELEAESLQQRLQKLTADADNLRIDLSTRDTEVENLKFRSTAVRDERDTLRNDLKLQTTRAKDAEARLALEEHRALRSEDKLAREISERTDKETALERRLLEISRLREKLKHANSEAREASRALRNATLARPGAKVPSPSKTVEDPKIEESEPAMIPIPGPTLGKISEQAELDPYIAELADEASSRATALSERVMASMDGFDDDSIRQEMADLAADMVALTATVEGPQSPIHAMLSVKSANAIRQSLASKAKKTLESSQEPA